MKNLLLRSLLALVALCPVLTLTAAEAPVDQVPARIHVNGSTVSAGDARVMVAARLGSPSAVLPDGSWLYPGYTARQAGREAISNATLVVRFDDHKVSRLSLADHATIAALRQASRRAAPTQLLAVR